jgi:hypothetical protein
MLSPHWRRPVVKRHTYLVIALMLTIPKVGTVAAKSILFVVLTSSLTSPNQATSLSFSDWMDRIIGEYKGFPRVFPMATEAKTASERAVRFKARQYKDTIDRHCPD